MKNNNLDLDKLRALHEAAGITTLEVTADYDDGFALCDSRGVCHAVVSFSDQAKFLAAIHNTFPAMADRLDAAEREREELLQRLAAVELERNAAFSMIKGMHKAARLRREASEKK